jgi:hypothetical protein
MNFELVGSIFVFVSWSDNNIASSSQWLVVLLSFLFYFMLESFLKKIRVKIRLPIGHLSLAFASIGISGFCFSEFIKTEFNLQGTKNNC